MASKSIFLASRVILRVTSAAATLMVTGPVAATPVLAPGVGTSNAQHSESMAGRLLGEDPGAAIGALVVAILPDPDEQGEDADDQVGDGDDQGMDLDDLDDGDQGEDEPDAIA